MQTAATDSLVGRKLEGRYRILDRIARGGMSTVYAAVDERLDRLVAVKVMSPALSADPAFSDRFAREARAAARLTHLNTVSVYDQGHEIGPDGHHVFLVMELVEGRTLRELMRERGKLGAAEAVSIMEPVLSALAAAHRAGLVHRDVKPENILLSDEGVVKVADFGLARAVESDAASTRTGLMMGTIAYCAPEQISKGNADPRSDVYAAGVVLFELLTGQTPYKGDSAMNIAYQHVHSRVPAPSSRVRGLPSELDEVVVAATDSDPSGRPTDAAAFLAELADVRSELGLPVVPIPPRVRPRRSDRSETSRNDTVRTAGQQGTTDLLSRAGSHDTTVVARRSVAPNGATRTGRIPPRDDNAPPPPVVIPPPKPRKQVSSRTRGRRRALIATLIVLLLGAGSFLGAKAVIEWRFAHVPNVDGAVPSVALAKLKDAGYTARSQPGPEFSDTVPAGHVIRTDPRGGTRLATGKTVTITVSAGPQLYQIPNVQGSDPEAARAELLGLGPLTVTQQVQKEYSDTVKANTVTRTVPAAGQKISHGQAITIYVSLGPPIIDVPKIAQGTPVDDATKTLKSADFKVTTLEQFDDTVQKGTVISVDPSDRATKFSTITLTVSKGPDIVNVPAIAPGTPADQAAQAVRDAGLEPKFSVFGGTDPGTVIAIVPGAGTPVHTGTTVTIYTLAK
ncbi:MAG TPA: Stk1 family PASTA domain-containing Ser/Thr kinase [Jatrophihabitans sp.]|uniref:Stk1 family PASTA domain-containing Ser/Thr kinase n=1 Tax=Jatrophihabitans sp. TaxID=1932789 RepID=UPI002E0904A4|nr:Stk1 family PASTA domain-containing Ser/Thr kinase [Jatrophihabitans sp.]